MPRITTGDFPGPAGPIEYVLNEPDAPYTPRRGAVICHPHPLFGGTLHTRIVFHAARALQEIGIPVLRFNFRGVGKSAGVHDRGVGEVGDLRAALDYLGERFAAEGPLPLILAGFSFGSFVALRLLERDRDPRVQRLVGLGIPASTSKLPRELAWRGPKLFISGTRDQYGATADVTAYFEALPPPKRLIWLDGADHFLTGRMDEFRRLLAENLDFDEAFANGFCR